MIANVKPNVDITIDERETISAEGEIAIVVIPRQIRSRRDRIVFPGGKSPGAPLLRIIDLEDAGDEAGPVGGSDLIGALFGAGAVEVAAVGGVGDVGVESLVLGAEAGRAVDGAGGAEGEEGLFDVLGVVAQVGPGFAVGVGAEDGVDGGDVGGGVEVGDVVAEVEEVLRAVRGVPVKLLPCFRGVIHRSPYWEGDCHGEITVIYQGLEAEQGLELIDSFGIVCSNEGVEFVDDIVDTRDAVLRSEFLDRSVPLGVGEYRMDHGATSNTTI